MIEVLGWARDHLSGRKESETPYECASCNSRFERQPHSCSGCGSYQIDWVGWREEYLE